MIRIPGNSPAAKAAVVTAAVLPVAAIWTAIAVLIALGGLHQITIHTNWRVLPEWLWYYRHAPILHAWLLRGYFFGGLIVAFVLLLLVWDRRGKSQYGEARFANEREIEAAGLRGGNGILLGKLRSRFLTTGPEAHVMLEAPTGSGKGVGIVIPNLLNWPGSVVNLDMKRENFAKTAGFRARHGQRVHLFDPLDPDRAASRYNPLAYIDRGDDVLVIDELQKIAGMLFPLPERGEAFWAEAARTAFIGVGAYVAATPTLPFTIGQLYRDITEGDPKTRLPALVEARAAAGTPLSGPCVTALTDFTSASDNTFSGIKQTVTTKLGLWLNPHVDAATSASDFDLRRLRTEPMTIYLGASPNNIDRVAPLYNLIFQQLVDLNTDPTIGEFDPASQHRVLVLLDEFARLGKAPVIVSAISYVRSFGLNFLIVVQTRAQLRRLNGDDGAEELITNCDAQVVYTPGSRKEGTFHIVGGDLAALARTPRLVMAEGYATAAIVAEAASQPVVAAFDAGNLLPVAEALHARFPDKPILIAGDDDRGVELKEGHNPGRDKATAAAVVVEGLAVFPAFAPGEVEADPKRFTDFNDLATASVLGREAVAAQISAAIDLLARKQAAAGGGDIKKEVEMANIEHDDSATPASEQPGDRDRTMDAAADRAPNRVALFSGEVAGLTGGGEARAKARAGQQSPSLDAGDVPPAIAARYLVETSRWTGRRGYFESSTSPDAAFHDRGAALVSQSESPAVIADMVAIAQHRRWETLEVAGSEAFRREAWLRAREAGLAVNGYRPTEREVQEATRRSGRVESPASDRHPATPAGQFPAGDAEPAPRQYLSVPFADKDAARQAGAKWDGKAKSWYVDGRDTSAVERWVPSEKQARTEKVIAADPNARAQLRAIEAVVGATLADNPEARRRVLEAGRESLAERVSQDKTVLSPQLQASERLRDAAGPSTSSVKSTEPALPQRRPPERTRGR